MEREVLFEAKHAEQVGEVLIQAIRRKKHVLVEKLLQNGCSPDCRDLDKSKYYPALAVTVFSRNLASLKLLLDYGADVNVCDRRGMTAVMYAADFGLLDYLHALVDKGANVNLTDKRGMNCLMFAAQANHFDCVTYLLENNINVDWLDNDGKTALMFAASRASTECVHLLISSNADINIKDKERGFTALMHAIENQATESVNLLLKKNAEVNVVGIGKEKGTTALTLAFRNAKSSGDFTVLEQLLLQGADMSISISDRNFLHEMIGRGKKKIVQLMIRNGCSPSERRCREHCFKFSEHEIPISPLCVALLSGFDDLAKYLIMNQFFTKYDVTSLPNNARIRQKIPAKNREAHTIFDYMSTGPQSLKVLCFVIQLDMLNGVTSLRSKCVKDLGLPPSAQQKLLFQTPESSLCLSCWHELSLKEDQFLENCTNCVECGGRGFRVKQNKKTLEQ